jgi:hypothetical protein
LRGLPVLNGDGGAKADPSAEGLGAGAGGLR